MIIVRGLILCSIFCHLLISDPNQQQRELKIDELKQLLIYIQKLGICKVENGFDSFQR